MVRVFLAALLVGTIVVGEPLRAGSDGEAGGSRIGRGPASPPLAVHLTFPHPPSRLGWGSFDLAAAPEVDEIGVRVTVGAPVRASRWASCERMRLRAGTRVQEVPLRHIEVGMAEGVYEAVTGSLTIEHLRALAGEPSIEAEVCDDRVPLSGPGGRAVREFVRDFDERALDPGPPPPRRPPELLPDGRWRLEDEPSLLPVPA